MVEWVERVICCGGFNFSEEGAKAKISWDILHPDYQRKGVGSKLLQFRIHKLKEIETVKNISVRTSQLVFQFYEKHGFELKEVVKNYWAGG
ncbi:MAG TPA: GNAT family N-acetyltransferase [Chitinophagaceae bacterium]|nr:GNAT family N-acetyltransferase [Chitinophagaceae bacterium]